MNEFTLKELIIFGCIDAGGIRKVLEDNCIELSDNELRELETTIHNKLLQEVK